MFFPSLSSAFAERWTSTPRRYAVSTLPAPCGARMGIPAVGIDAAFPRNARHLLLAPSYCCAGHFVTEPYFFV